MEGNRNDRRFLTEFIELYRSFPCLWKIKSLEYNDRDAKRKAYVVLVKKLRQRIPNATRETVVRKINTLRTTYRREWRKVIRSSSVAASSDGQADGGQQPQHIHVPQLWYFDMMHFIRNDDDDEDGDEGQDYEDDNGNANVTAEQMQLIGGGGGGGQATSMDSTGQFANTPQVGCLTKFEECTESELQPISHDPASSSSTSFPQIVLPHLSSFSSPPQSLPVPPPLSTTSNKRKLMIDDNQQQQQSFDENFKRLRELIEIRLPPPVRTNFPEEVGDQFSQMAQIWATKLRLLPRERALFAEKKINDILFEACLVNLQQQQQQQQQHHIVSENNFPVITTSLSSTSSLNYGNNNSNNNSNNTATSSQTHCNGFQ